MTISFPEEEFPFEAFAKELVTSLNTSKLISTQDERVLSEAEVQEWLDIFSKPRSKG